jgi:CBS domain-containing protein
VAGTSFEAAITMLISQVLGKKVFTVSAKASVNELAKRLAHYDVGALLVTGDSDEIVGIVSERDVVRAMATTRGIGDQMVETIMTAEVEYLTPSTQLDEVFGFFTVRGYRHAPVKDETGEVIGVLSIRDLVAARMEELESEKDALIEYIQQAPVTGPVPR